MRVAQLVGVRRFDLVEEAIGDPGPGEVQVRVEAVGICGSDMHSYSEGAVGDTPCLYPMVLGHEPAGVVTRTGPGVTGWSAGDLVACEPALFCYHCELCHAGRHNLCSAMRFLSTPGHPGFFRDTVNLPAENVLALPRGLSAADGALVEPLAVALHSLRLAPPALGETAVVFGAGPIGALTVAVLKLAGAGRVWVVEPLPHRRAMALDLGADAALDPRQDAVAGILSDTRGRGVDLVIDCAAKDDTANDSIRLARLGGRVVYTGIGTELRVPMDVHTWRRKELAVWQVRRSNREGHAAIDLLARHQKRLGGLVTHSRALEEIGTAFGLVESYADGVGKLVVRPNGGGR
jgi:L-iditol 2-dehydrogenase